MFFVGSEIVGGDPAVTALYLLEVNVEFSADSYWKCLIQWVVGRT